ncbi:MAG: sarcosine oxidase subunit gamma family protein [Thiolinea sp.]
MAKPEMIPVYETALEQADLSVLSGKAVNLQELRDYGFVVLRIRPDSAGAAAALTQLGLELPPALGMTGSLDSRLVKWISPDEYLITLPLSAKDAFIREATTALEGVFSAVVDNSGAYSLLKLSGEHALDLLSKLTFYDVRGKLPVGKVVSTQMSKAPVIFYRLDDDALMLMLRWSFADYAWKIMHIAAEEYL